MTDGERIDLDVVGKAVGADLGFAAERRMVHENGARFYVDGVFLTMGQLRALRHKLIQRQTLIDAGGSFRGPLSAGERQRLRRYREETRRGVVHTDEWRRTMAWLEDMERAHKDRGVPF